MGMGIWTQAILVTGRDADHWARLTWINLLDLVTINNGKMVDSYGK